MSLDVLSAIQFFPRGGSSLAARELALGLGRRGRRVRLVAGSCSEADAGAFYGKLDLHRVDFDPALAAGEPMRFDPGPGHAPLHASFEDRPGAPDVALATLDDETFERQVEAWSRELERAGAPEAAVLHLHHLTVMNEAARRVAPEVPVVSQLHGTELLMLERIAEGPPPGWTHAEAWAERLRAWAERCAALTTATEAGARRAAELLGLERDRFSVVPSGFDERVFRPRPVDRCAHYREHLVDRPAGRSYTVSELEALADGPVLIYVGRFMAVKRVPLLIRAFARARRMTLVRPALVLVGGHPGEIEGEDPAAVADELGVPDVFFAGWHEHERLPEFLAASDVFVLPSIGEQFGQALVEAMGCGLPPIAVDRLGPAEIVKPGRTGWLVEPDDELGLANAIVEAVERRDERGFRGRAAAFDAHRRWTWTGAAAALDAVLCGPVDRREITAAA